MKQDEAIKKFGEKIRSSINGMREQCRMLAGLVESLGVPAAYLQIQTKLPSFNREMLDEMLKFGQFPELATDDDMLRISIKACSDQKILPSHQ